MPRVMFLSTTLARGGAEGQVCRLALEMRSRGWEPAVVSLAALSGYARELEEAGIATYSLGMRPGAPDPRGPARLALILSRFRPQVLHSHMFHANTLARAARLFCPVPVLISTLHSMAETPQRGPGVGGQGPQPRLRDWVYRVTGPLADVVVAVSQAAADRHVSGGAVSRRKMCVIPNGVDTAVFRPDDARRNRVRRELGLGSHFAWLAAGRLMWKKDYPTLLRAFTVFSGQAGSVAKPILLVAGEGPQEVELKDLAAQFAVDARFLGRVDDMASLMNAADALVLSSVVEGLPLTLLEAAASGLSIVATDVGGVREVVAEEGCPTGFLTPAGDPEALANAMLRLVSLPPDGRAGMSRNARLRAVERFEIGAVASQWDELYRELLETAPWT